MRRFFLIYAIICLPFLSAAQKADTVVKKISKLPYTKCEIPPQFKNGSLSQFISLAFKKPAYIKGKFKDEVIVSLLIDSSGKLNKIQFVKNLSPEINKEALRVLRQTQWSPAINNFKHVTYNLVLRVELKYDNVNGFFYVSCIPAYANQTVNETNKTENADKVYSTVEKEPAFPGGDNALNAYLKNHIKYPAHARQRNIQGLVIVSFTVEKDGALTDFLVWKSPDEELSIEALRVLKQCPKFTLG
ncbi:MAG: TonB family protein, partial [Mucilaginibacter sp.]